MKLMLIFVLLLGLAESGPVVYIINGETSEIGRWPWQVSLQEYVMSEQGFFGWTHACGGSLIRRNWVLTAAHCLEPDPRKELYVVKLGVFQLSKAAYFEQQELEIAEIIMHPWFYLKRPGISNDIALLRLARDADLSNPYINVISLPERGQQFAGNKICYITGWGRIDRSTIYGSDKLQEAHVPVWTNQQCKNMYGFLGWLHPVFENHICTGDPSPGVDISACQGDSGGPLMCDVNGTGDWRLAGVTSRGGHPDCKRYPSVYMRVSSYLDWIDSHIA